MRVYLIRHGIAIDRDAPGCPDEAKRFLTDEGESLTRQAMLGLRELGLHPGLILASPYVRAAQTAAIAADALGVSHERIRSTRSLLPGADPRALFDELSRLSEEEVACCGHAPHLDGAVAAAVAAASPFTTIKKAGAAGLEFPEDPRPGTARLLWLYPAGALRALGK